jgi:peptide/nickel transport system substrate-binding protein
LSREEWRRLDRYRRTEAGPIENTLLDELIDGEIDRGEFVRRAGVLGISASIIVASLAAVGKAPAARAGVHAAKAGGRIRVGVIPAPAGALEPHTLVDVGGLETSGITGEFLTRTTSTLGLRPELATSWKANKNAFARSRSETVASCGTCTPRRVAAAAVEDLGLSRSCCGPIRKLW